jgi:hypothetical protein
VSYRGLFGDRGKKLDAFLMQRKVDGARRNQIRIIPERINANGFRCIQIR